MLALNDKQLELVMTAAKGLEPGEKRSLFLERVAAKLALRGHRFTDVDLETAIRLALTGLIQSAAWGRAQRWLSTRKAIARYRHR